MPEFEPSIAVIVAVIEQARLDAIDPKLCSSPAQRDRIQWEAREFLEQVVEPAAAECRQDVVIPHRATVGAATRWEMSGDLQEAERVRDYLQRRRLAGHDAGRKRVEK